MSLSSDWGQERFLKMKRKKNWTTDYTGNFDKLEHNQLKTTIHHHM